MQDQRDLHALAHAIVDRLPVDWQKAQAESSDAERDAVRELQVIAEIASIHRTVRTDSASPRNWGPFRILEHIGRGTYGNVYRAIDTRLDREIALKLLRKDETESDAAGTETIDEARLLARVHHPNVVTIHGADRIDGHVGLWMECVRGRTLEQIVRDHGPFSATEVALVAVEVCSAVAAVHAAGLLHRDVKAQNVMRDASGRHVLMDFGAGRVANACSEVDLAGTPLYLAPELLDGHAASPQSDVYSVGVLLFHLATAAYPADGRTTADLRARHAGGQRIDIRTLRPDLPEALSALIGRALNSRPSDRFETAEAMANAAVQIVNPVSSGPRRAARTQTMIVWAVAAVVVVSASWFIVAKESKSDPGVRTRLLWDDAIDLAGTTTADGHLLSFADWETGNLAVRDLTSGRTSAVTKSGYAVDGNVEYSAISPDGNWIAYGWLNWPSAQRAGRSLYELRVINIDGTGDRLLRRGDADASWWAPLAWSPDSQWIAASTATRRGWTIERVSRDGTSANTVATLDDDAARAIRVSSDGQWLAFHRQKHGISIVRSDGSTGAPTTVVDAARLLGWTSDGRLLSTRERSGASEVFSLPIANGRVAGESIRVDAVADMGHALGLTASGSLIYGKTNSAGTAVNGLGSLPSDAVSVAIDPHTGAIGPERVTQAVEVYGLFDMGGGVRYAPDGTRVLYTPAHGTVLIRSFNGASRTLVPQLQAVGRIEWAPDSRSLVVNGIQPGTKWGIYRIDLDTGAATLLAPRERSTAHALAPDGRTLYISSGFDPHALVVARDLQTGVERQLRDLDRTVTALRVSPDGRTLAIATLDAVEIVNLSTKKTTMRIDGSAKRAQFWGGDWRPDGKEFFVPASFGNVHPRGELWRIRMDGTATERHSLKTAARGVSVRPDGRELSMVQWEERQQVWIVENFLPALAKPAR